MTIVNGVKVGLGEILGTDDGVAVGKALGRNTFEARDDLFEFSEEKNVRL